MVFHRFWRFGPFKRQVYDFTRSANRFQCLESRFQHSHLAIRITWLTQGATQGIFNRRDPGHTHRGSQIGNGCQVDRCKAGSFQFALYQSYGPAADRSGRHQHNHIGKVFFQVPDQRRNCIA